MRIRITPRMVLAVMLALAAAAIVGGLIINTGVAL